MVSLTPLHKSQVIHTSFIYLAINKADELLLLKSNGPFRHDCEQCLPRSQPLDACLAPPPFFSAWEKANPQLMCYFTGEERKRMIFRAFV